MLDRLAVITGASSGLGMHLAERLVRRHWNIVLLNRDRPRSQHVMMRLAAVNPQASIDLIETDLADEDAIARAASVLTERYPRIDGLFNNAGVLLGELRSSKHGNDMHFQVNTLAPYILMRRLADMLAASGGVVVNVSSGAISMTGPLRIDELRRPPRLRKLVGAYAQSKLALTTLTNGMSPEYAARNVSLRSMDPGGNKTNMTAGEGMPKPLLWLRPLLFKSPQKGAEEIYDAAFAPKFSGRTGLYIAKGEVAQPPKDANNPEIQAALLRLCRESTGI
jgi:NAD(P)-dependent dehydrogenase (short-subunit alcohol dehydrogenase family)